ncbi:MAG: hypothetical protein AAF799_03210 [Myxococcota bacterium]
MDLKTIGLLCSFTGLLCACGDDAGDETSNTSVAMTTTEGETDNGTAGTTDNGTAGTPGETDNGTAGTSDTEGGETSQPGDTTSDEETTGSGAEVCDTCDPATEYCFESIIDGPSIFDCREIPKECTKDPTCDCISPIACPESLQACIDEEPVLVECVEG